jgi:hypothetical protein
MGAACARLLLSTMTLLSMQLRALLDHVEDIMVEGTLFGSNMVLVTKTWTRLRTRSALMLN